MARTGETAAGQGPWAWLAGPVHIGPGRELLTWAIVAIGVALRVAGYAKNRHVYIDEKALLENLVNLPVFDFHTTLTEFQMAPPGFLALGRMLVRLPGNDVMEARFLSLVCGIAAMFLFRALARRFLLPHAVPIAVGFFALSDWLIYYSAEIKQYSCDLALTLVALLLAAGPTPDNPAPRRLLALGIFGVVGVWFSFPLAFVLAGIGTYLVGTAMIRRDVRGILRLAAMGLAWTASIAACFVVSRGLLKEGRFIWDWWAFAFLPLPPRSLAELQYDFWHIVNVFDSPADVKSPMGPVVTVILASILAIAGAVSLLRRWPGGLYLLAAPWAFALTASALHQYPFHGRLLLFLVPSVHMLVAEGAAAVARPGGWRLAAALGAFLLYQPAVDAVWYQFVASIHHGVFDSHGDLRHDLLDYLELNRARRPKP
jgi:hypothetical protein